MKLSLSVLILILCGGCTFQNMNYSEQVKLKSELVYNILSRATGDVFIYENTVRSPKEFEYRNKMEFSFGNEVIGRSDSL